VVEVKDKTGGWEGGPMM